MIFLNSLIDIFELCLPFIGTYLMAPFCLLLLSCFMGVIYHIISLR